MAITSTTRAPGPSGTSEPPLGSVRPRWARPALIALLGVTAALYLWDLSASGWANDFYAAAAQAGTKSWRALLFGSLDAGNAITVDKPPAALWLMGLSGRIFGFNPWSMLVPQALCGVGAVALLHAAVRRWCGPAAGLLAGAALAATPVAALMFRFNNPDALLVLLLVAAAYCVVRGTETAGVGWLALAGAALGFAFLTKLLQAFLVLPALGLVFLVAAPVSLGGRIWRLAVAGAALACSAGWYPALVALWPADSRPYIGGSTDNSLLELALGYNGLGRILGGHGNPTGGPGPGPGPAGPGGPPGPPWPSHGGNPMFGGHAGLGRLFGTAMGPEISWLLPAALIGLVAGLWLTRRAPRTDRTRAALLLWGGWMLVSGLVFSYMSGIIHPYYMVALAPGVAGTVGIAAVELWRRRDRIAARVTLAAMLAATGIWNFALLDRTPDWLPWLRWTALVGALAVAAAMAVGAAWRRFGIALVAAGLVCGLGASAAYAVDTAARPHTGGIPLSGPRAGAFGPGPGPGRPGPGRDDSDNAALRDLLTRTHSRWAAAAVGAFDVSGLELRTGKPIMAIGGFAGEDPAPTLAQFQSFVAAGAVRYFLPGEAHGPHRDSDTAGAAIRAWVRTAFRPLDVGGTTVYDLSEVADE